MASYWDRYAVARVSRRTVLRSAAIASAAGGAIAIAGCSSGKSGDRQPSPTKSASPTDSPDVLNAAPDPRRGGTFTSANSATFGTFDPHLGIEVASAYFPRIYNVLLNQSATKPDLHVQDPPRREDRPE